MNYEKHDDIWEHSHDEGYLLSKDVRIHLTKWIDISKTMKQVERKQTLVQAIIKLDKFSSWYWESYDSDKVLKKDDKFLVRIEDIISKFMTKIDQELDNLRE